MLRQELSAPGMYAIAHDKILNIPDTRLQRPSTIPIVDAVMSAAAMFSLKSASLLQFNESVKEPAVSHNLRSLFKVGTIPSDTSMREIIDPIATEYFQNIYKPIFSVAQRGKVLEKFKFFEDSYLVSIDGTGFFSSHDIHCDNCCVKNHKDGSKTYYHQMLAGVLIHPDRKEVIPFAPEPISNTDGSTKNDCERNAAERFLKRFRREHPHLNIIITEDGLSSNAPHIRLLKELEMGYILGVKPGDHKSLFEFIDASEKINEVSRCIITEGKAQHEFRWMNGVPLNDSNPDVLVNFIEYWQKTADVVLHFSWITHFEITKDNVILIMRGGRARWRIENETFNTLKNLGYNFEHNFGHGYQNLSNNFAVIMMLVFMIDQLQQICCELFQKAVVKAKRISYLWPKMRNYFGMMKFDSWEDFLKALAFGIEITFRINTS